MNEWQQSFAGKIEALRETWAQRFDTMAKETLEPTFEEFTEFVQQWNIQSNIPRAQNSMRSFKFILAEDAYVLIFFRGKGVDAVECQYGCAIPGQGTSEGPRSDTMVCNVDRKWAENCFKTALDAFVTKLTESEQTKISTTAATENIEVAEDEPEPANV